MHQTLVKTSKFLSFVLRHRPGAVGLTLDREGWADIAALIAGAQRTGRRIDFALIRAVVETNDKQRFALSPDGLRIRAVQGHTTAEVARAYPSITPPDVLYHGTADRFVNAILADGLKPMRRHGVHLTADRATARIVGARHGLPVVFAIASSAMYREGFVFHQAENGVWLTSAVPPRFLSVQEQA